MSVSVVRTFVQSEAWLGARLADRVSAADSSPNAPDIVIYPWVAFEFAGAQHAGQ
jgi:hypothetical protein